MYLSPPLQQVVLPRKCRTTVHDIPAFVPPLTVADPHQLLADHVSDTISKSKSGTNSTNSSDDETYVSAASSETNLTGLTPTADSATSASGKGGEHGLLLTRQALHTYHASNHLVLYKYAQYGRTHADLPRYLDATNCFRQSLHYIFNSSRLAVADAEIREEVYEVDTDPDRIDEQMTRSQAESITKQGFLLKGPDTSSDRIFVHIGSKSFKRRYCYLRQEVDGTWILELHKDERQLGDAKTTYVMDFCTAVVPNHKRGRFCFELCMSAGHKSVTLAAESEADLADWLGKLTSVVAQHKALEDKRVASLERAAAPPASPAGTTTGAATATGGAAMMFGTLKGLDQSMNPQLIRYGRETDVSIAQARREQRRRLFNVYRTSPTRTFGGVQQPIGGEASVEPYR